MKKHFKLTLGISLLTVTVFLTACTVGLSICEHTFGNLVTTKAATDDENGEGYYQCRICKYKKPVEIPSIKYAFIKGRTVDGATNVDVGNTVFTKGRTVILSDFYLGRYEVTQAEYKSVMEGQKVTDVNGTEHDLNSTPSSFDGSDSTKIHPGDIQEKRPVERVTWYDAVWYCNALSIDKGLEPAYTITVKAVNDTGHITDATVVFNKKSKGYRLPTEAEWEFAARGGDPSTPDWSYDFSGAPSGETTVVENREALNTGIDAVGWYVHNCKTGTTVKNDDTYSCYTHEVGKKAPNRLGLYDMTGNVAEWVYDYFQIEKESGTFEDPVIEEGSSFITRGGSWADDSTSCTNAGAAPWGKTSYMNYRGFRVARYAE